MIQINFDKVIQKGLLKSKDDRIHFILIAIALWPAVFSLIIGAHKDVHWYQNNDIIFRGYISWLNLNWIGFIIFLPLGFWFLSIILEMLFGINLKTNTSHILSIEFFEGENRNIILNNFQEVAQEKKNIFLALILSLIFNVFDLWELGTYYFSELFFQLNNPFPPKDPGWGHFFLIKEQANVSVFENLLLVLFAYLNQLILMFVIFFGCILVFRHNMHYLKLIYQRYRTEKPKEQFIILDFKDDDGCFGLKKLNKVFNKQVIMVVIIGFLLLFSRYANVKVEISDQIYGELANIDVNSYTELFKFCIAVLLIFINHLNQFFPDFGQICIPIIWLISLFVVSIPAAPKFLPYLCQNIRNAGLSKKEYLLQFIPPDNFLSEIKKEGKTEDKAIEDLQKLFSKNSFWPSGDQRAGILYTLAFFVFFILIFPLHFKWHLGFFVYLITGVVVSITLTYLLKLAILFPLHWVDPLIVNRKWPWPFNRK